MQRSEIEEALAAGAIRARELLAAGLIDGAALRLAWRDASWSAQAVARRTATALHEGVLENA